MGHGRKWTGLRRFGEGEGGREYTDTITTHSGCCCCSKFCNIKNLNKNNVDKVDFQNMWWVNMTSDLLRHPLRCLHPPST